MWQPCIVRWRLAFLSNKVFLNKCIFVVCLDTMQLYSLQTTEQCNYNFYMQWETKNFVWLILFQWSGTEPAISLKYAYRHSTAILISSKSYVQQYYQGSGYFFSFPIQRKTESFLNEGETRTPTGKLQGFTMQ